MSAEAIPTDTGLIPQQPVKRPVGRPSLYKETYCDQVVEEMSQGKSLTAFAAEIGVARSTIQQWEFQHPDFSVAVQKGKAKCAAWWETLARRNAENGTGNPALTIFGLKNMAPDDWRERIVTENLNLNVEVSKSSLDPRELSPEAREALRLTFQRMVEDAKVIEGETEES